MDENAKTRTRWLWALCALLLIGSLGVLVATTSAQQRRRSEAVGCASRVQSIVLAARMWANDNGDRLPPDIVSMSKELSSPRVLHCPADRARPFLTTWERFTPADSSYDLVSPGAAEGDTNMVVIRCSIHQHLGYVDGTVFDGVRRVRDRPRK